MSNVLQLYFHISLWTKYILFSIKNPLNILIELFKIIFWNQRWQELSVRVIDWVASDIEVEIINMRVELIDYLSKTNIYHQQTTFRAHTFPSESQLIMMVYADKKSKFLKEYEFNDGGLPHVKLNIGNTCFQQFFRLTLRFSNFSYGTPWQFSHWSMLLYCWLQPFLFTNIWKIKTIHLLQTLLRTMTKVLIVRR